MNNAVTSISFFNLLFAFIPVGIVIVIIWKWQLQFKTALYAVFRMLIQLVLIGYCLTYIFKSEYSWVVIGVLTIMLFSSSWISLRTLPHKSGSLYLRSFLSILIGGGTVLILVTQLVIRLEPWFLPSYMIPLAGMIFANSMNTISLAGERMSAELTNQVSYEEARKKAFQASLIPITNSLFAVGLVSLPGMMTGQILSGVSPFIAARYQIMVMCMTFGSSGLSAALFLTLNRRNFNKTA